MALDALMGNAPASIRTIPVASGDDADPQESSEVSQLDYLAVPVGDFGQAVLRGMGWKDTETIREANGEPSNVLKPKIHDRRPALLGVGAKPSSAVGVELGEWGKNSLKKGAQAVSYNPILLKNKNTGELLSEEQLQARITDQEKSSTLVLLDEDRPSKDITRKKDSDRGEDGDRDRRRDRDRDDRKRRDDERSDKRHRDRSRSPKRYDRKEKKRRYRSRSRSSSRDRYRSRGSERKGHEGHLKRR